MQSLGFRNPNPELLPQGGYFCGGGGNEPIVLVRYLDCLGLERGVGGGCRKGRESSRAEAGSRQDRVQADDHESLQIYLSRNVYIIN